MTYVTDIPDRMKSKLPRENIVGPYSKWPRKTKTSRRKKLAVASSVGVAAVFVHCVAPLLA
ncbi:hypothetical protein O2N63_01945 [Aliiroseovarius sp. KMU-50]|uniref:Uncharacterized protein n=1 Tax=Aliiroseovarius salicola TaxID=3009082 RepID=A0ABT4VYN5_9RHOB|nr:hypothetical protein [Aliiroseovarius sp. KMU-50]MDA5092845.1 hypothetical protein [Aliiroseovarius sp. KMU-50]